MSQAHPIPPILHPHDKNKLPALSPNGPSERDRQREAYFETVVYKRNRDLEKKIWDTNIAPLIERYWQEIEFQYFETPAEITERHLDVMLRATMALCLNDEGAPLFRTDVFEREVMESLYHGQTYYGENQQAGMIDLKGKFYFFLKELLEDPIEKRWNKHPEIEAMSLPVFLFYLYRSYGIDGIWSGPAILKEYTEVLANHMEAMKLENGQYPTKEEARAFLKARLEQDGKSLGPSSILPNSQFNKIWEKVPHRGQGQKTS